MKRVAVTGAFGSGKSLVLRLLSPFLPVLSLDRVVGALYREKAVRKRLERAFGTAEKKELARIVFSSPAKRRKLEGLLWPMAWKELCSWAKKQRAKGKNAAGVEVPLLFEAGWEKHFDKVVVVHCPRKEMLRRLAKKGFSAKEARARWKAQLPLRVKKRRADFLVDNGKSRDFTRSQVLRFLASLQLFSSP